MQTATRDMKIIPLLKQEFEWEFVIRGSKKFTYYLSVRRQPYKLYRLHVCGAMDQYRADAE